MVNLYNTNRNKVNKYIKQLDENYINTNFNIQKIYKEQNHANLILSWSFPPRPLNYSTILKNLYNHDINTRQKFIYNYINKNALALSADSTIDITYNSSLDDTRIANTHFVQSLVNDAINNKSFTTTVENYNTTVENYNTTKVENYNTTVENYTTTVGTTEYSTPPNYIHITSALYSISCSISGNIIVEANSVIQLPLASSIPHTGYSISIINKYSNSIILNSIDNTLMYNYFFAPNGDTSILIPSNAALNLLFISNISNNTYSWQLNFW
jgi:hypothetical protein